VAATVALLWLGASPLRGQEQPEHAPSPEAPPTAEAPAEEGPPGEAASAPGPQLFRVEGLSLEVKLPAPYWQYSSREQLEEQMQGGCGPARVPEDLLFAINHRDARATIWCESGPRRYLMRDKDDLERYVDSFMNSIKEQVEAPGEVESSFHQRDHTIVHRFAFSVSQQAGGGGCAPGGEQGQTQRARYMFVHYFVRPRNEDALFFRLFCGAPAEVFEELRSELEFIIESLRYTGAKAQTFFKPDAPAEKVLTPEEAAEAAPGRKGGSYGWMIAIGVFFIIFWLMRRRKEAAA
jgi:hypothetical protein